MPEENIRVGVIGVGHLGQHHARILASLPGVILVGVADQDSERGQLIAEKHKVPSYKNYQELLAQVQAVSVAVPTSLHAKVVQDCLQKSIHVLVEKPIASTLEEGRGLVELARQMGVQLQVGHVERFNPILDLIRPILDCPRYIQCNRFAPYQVRGTDVDVVLDLMIHDLDIVLSWGLGPITNVEALGVSVMSAHHDFARARIEFEGGGIAECSASRVASHRLRNFSFIQPDLSVSADYQTRQGVLFRKNISDPGTNNGVGEVLQGGSDDALTRELQAFIRSIQEKVNHGVSGEEGLHALELAYSVLAGLARRDQTGAKDRSAFPGIPIEMN